MTSALLAPGSAGQALSSQTPRQDTPTFRLDPNCPKVVQPHAVRTPLCWGSRAGVGRTGGKGLCESHAGASRVLHGPSSSLDVLPFTRSLSRAWPSGAACATAQTPWLPRLPAAGPTPSLCGMQRSAGRLTCVADLLEAEQAEDAVVELHLLAVALVHLVQDLHQLIARLGWVGTRGLVHCQLVERAVPWAADTLVLALRHPGEEASTAVTPAPRRRWLCQWASNQPCSHKPLPEGHIPHVPALRKGSECVRA